MSSLLIIGGSGFFGKCFIDYFEKYSFKSWGIKNIYITSRTKKIILGHQTLIYNSEDFMSLPETDYIIYAASSTDQKTYTDNFSKEIQEQKKAMENFHKSIDAFSKPPKKILYTSSGAVYGQSNLNGNKTNELKTQCEPDDNNSIKKNYANIKFDWENYLITNFPKNSIIARCFAFVGHRLPLDSHFVIGNFINDFLNSREIAVNSLSPVYRSYMHADDLVEWLLTILTSNKCLTSNIYNIGSMEEIEIHDLVNIFNQLSNKPKKRFNLDEFFIDRYVPNTTLSKETFNLKLKFDLLNSIKKTLSSHTSKERI